MAKKELTQREMYLASLIPEITSTSDPLGSRIDRVVSEANELQTQIHNTQKRLNALVKVNEPVAPEPTTKTTAGVTFGITGAVVIILFIFHCIIWLLKHLFSIHGIRGDGLLMP